MSTPRRRERTVRVCVWGTLVVLIVHALAIIATDGRNMPEAEDWLLVPALTGNEPNLPAWLWERNAEHLVALPKLLYLLVLELAGGDFRSGMVLNTMLLGALAAASVRVAAQLRGRLTYADALFPLLFLNTGQSNNFAWGWQIQYVLAVTLTMAPLYIMVRHGAVAPLRLSVVAACSIAALPLTGANGVIVAAALAPWYALVVLRQRMAPHVSGARARALLFGAGALIGVSLCALILVQYESPSWNPPNPGLRPTLITTVKFAAMAIGPGVFEHTWSVALVLAVVMSGATLSIARRTRLALTSSAAAPVNTHVNTHVNTRDDERWRLAGLVCFLCGCVAVTLALGYGRAGWVPAFGMPARYALLAVPTVVAVYYVWELYGPPRIARWAQGALLVLSIYCLPANYRAGRFFVNWMRDVMDAAQVDVDAGMSRVELARRHRQQLLHWDEPGLAARIGMLRDAGIGPFAKVPPDTAPAQIR